MTPETHPIDPEQVMAYLDGELAAGEAARVAKHIDQCASCAQLAADLRGVSARLLAWNMEPAPLRLSDAIAEEVSGCPNVTKEQVRRKGRLTSLWRHLLHSRPAWAFAGAGAALALAVVIVLSFGTLNRSRERAEVASREALSYTPKSYEDRLQSQISSAMENYRNSDQLSITTSESPEPAPPAAPAPETGPMIARTATLNVSVKQFDSARAAVERIVKAHHGYISTLNLSSEKGAPQSLEAKLAVPAGEYDAALADLRALGRVAQEQQSSEEVTSQVVDLDARLKNARETEAQLTEILRTRTGKVGDVLDVEREISRVRGEIESMEADQKSLRDRIAYASIGLNLSEEYQAQLGDAPSGARRELWNALVDGYHAAAGGLLKTFEFLLAVGPSLLIWAAILFWPMRWARRRWRAWRAAAIARS